MRRRVEEQRKFDNSNEVMISIGIPVEDQDNIRYFIVKTKDSKVQQEDFDLFMNMIAPKKKLLIQNQIFINKLSQNNIVTSMLKNLDPNHSTKSVSKVWARAKSFINKRVLSAKILLLKLRKKNAAHLIQAALDLEDN